MNATAHPARILVVDDEEHLADGVCEILQSEGYSAEVAHDGVEGLRKALAENFDLILLDVMMPKMDGLRTCDELRRNGLHTPVLFLTVKGAPEDRIRGLEAGGDDYLAKPFHLKELLLRVAAILRRGQWYARAGQTLSFNGNTIDFLTYHATAWDGGEHTLTHKEAMILKFLAEQNRRDRAPGGNPGPGVGLRGVPLDTHHRQLHRPAAQAIRAQSRNA